MISSYIVIMTERASLSHESKTVATLAATEKTGCWLGRERPPRESLCLVAQMEAAGTFSPLHPLRGLIETLKSKNSHEPDSSIHCHACTHLFPWRLWCESRETLQCLPPCQTEREKQGVIMLQPMANTLKSSFLSGHLHTNCPSQLFGNPS